MLATALVDVPSLSAAGVKVKARHCRPSPLLHPGETALKCFAPHDTVAALTSILPLAVDLAQYFTFKVLMFGNVPVPSCPSPAFTAFTSLLLPSPPERGGPAQR